MRCRALFDLRRPRTATPLRSIAVATFGVSASFVGSPPHVSVTCPSEDRERHSSSHSIDEPACRVNSPKLRPAGLACVEMGVWQRYESPRLALAIRVRWQPETTFSTTQKTGAMSDTLRMDYLVSPGAGNRVWHAVSPSQSQSDLRLVRPAQSVQQAQPAHMAQLTLEALHNLTRSGASSSPSRMSPAASPPDSGIPAR